MKFACSSGLNERARGLEAGGLKRTIALSIVTVQPGDDALDCAKLGRDLHDLAAPQMLPSRAWMRDLAFRRL